MRQSELKAILEDHKLWIQSAGREGKRASLYCASLYCADLRDANLRGANLQGANLRGAVLRSAYLQGAYLQGAYLQGANLTGANLWGANLAGANLHYAHLQFVNLRDAKFSTNFKKVRWFNSATFSEDQIPWVVLHPKYPVCADTIKWVKAKQLSA